MVLENVPTTKPNYNNANANQLAHSTRTYRCAADEMCTLTSVLFILQVMAIKQREFLYHIGTCQNEWTLPNHVHEVYRLLDETKTTTTTTYLKNVLPMERSEKTIILKLRLLERNVHKITATNHISLHTNKLKESSTLKKLKQIIEVAFDLGYHSHFIQIHAMKCLNRYFSYPQLQHLTPAYVFRAFPWLCKSKKSREKTTKHKQNADEVTGKRNYKRKFMKQTTFRK